MSLFLGIIIGIVLGAAIPSSFKAKASRIGAAARDAVVGQAPAPINPVKTVANIGIGFARICAACWKYKWVLLVLALFLFAGSLRGCHPFGLGQSRDDLRVEMAEAETKTRDKVIERNEELANLAQSVAVMRAELRALAQQGHDAIEAATPDNEAPIDAGVTRAWASSLDGLQLYPTREPDSSAPS